jgi:hypothetical protein
VSGVVAWHGGYVANFPEIVFRSVNRGGDDTRMCDAIHSTQPEALASSLQHSVP